MKCKYTSLVWLRVGSMSQSRSAKNKVYSTHYEGAYFTKHCRWQQPNQLKGICALKFSLANSCQRQSGEEESLLLPKDMYLVLWRKCCPVLMQLQLHAAKNSLPTAKTSFRFGLKPKTWGCGGTAWNFGVPVSFTSKDDHLAPTYSHHLKMIWFWTWTLQNRIPQDRNTFHSWNQMPCKLQNVAEKKMKIMTYFRPWWLNQE